MYAMGYSLSQNTPISTVQRQKNEERYTTCTCKENIGNNMERNCSLNS